MGRRTERVVAWSWNSVARAISARAAGESGSASTTGTPDSHSSCTRGLQRDLGEQRQPQLRREPAPPAGREDVGALAAVRAREVRHVLDDPQHRDPHLLEHLRAPERVPHRHFLRRGHDDRAAHLDRLDQGELRVAGARRHVHQEEVELAPFHVAQELLNDLHDDGAAPDGRRVALHQIAERHQLHAVRLDRLDAPFHHRRPLLQHAEHPREVRAVDVGVHQADPAARRPPAPPRGSPRRWTSRRRPCRTRSR